MKTTNDQPSVTCVLECPEKPSRALVRALIASIEEWLPLADKSTKSDYAYFGTMPPGAHLTPQRVTHIQRRCGDKVANAVPNYIRLIWNHSTMRSASPACPKTSKLRITTS
jgi:hypothetical protein